MLQTCWEKERAQNTSFGWKGNEIPKSMGVSDKEFGETVLWPVRPVWLCEKRGDDFEYGILSAVIRIQL